MMKIQLIAVALAICAVGIFAHAGSVSAHARLKESTPSVGEVLEASPAEVSITFTNDIQRIAGSYGIDVTNEGGQPVTAGPPVIDDDNRSLMTVPLQPALAPGRYVVMYRNVSDADGDPFEAGFAFYVGVEPTEDQLAEDALLEPPEVSATQTFATGNPSSPTAASDTPTPAVNITTPAPQATPTSPADDGESGGGVSATVIFVIAVAAAVAIIGGAVYFTTRRSKA